jgi:SAM-dependent methyltransferase
VLDVGGGLGGPARTLARELGCRVTVLDLTEAYCRMGEELTRRTGLAGQVEFRHGTALQMPFADAAFDVVWTQHSSMNVEDKERLYREIQRVARPGGRLAIHEIMAGAASPVHFPVPWAGDPSLSFLRPAEAVRRLLAGLGSRSWSGPTSRRRRSSGSASAWRLRPAPRRRSSGFTCSWVRTPGRCSAI